MEAVITAPLQGLDDEMAAVVQTARRSLVHVHNDRGAAGAGTIWHPDGLIVTNAHVVRHGPLQVTLPDETTISARLLAQDTHRDLAALSVAATGLDIISLGESRQLRPGQWVLAVGNPWGVVGAVTAGVVVGTGPAEQGNSYPQGDWVVVNLRLRPGYSGGPLLDIQGNRWDQHDDDRPWCGPGGPGTRGQTVPAGSPRRPEGGSLSMTEALMTWTGTPARLSHGRHR